jgi:DNA-binding beta-propeller fold protein YncE
MFRALFLVFAAVLPSAASSDILDIFKSDALTDGSQFAFAPDTSGNTIIAIDTQNHIVAAELEIRQVAQNVVATNELDLLVATHPDNQSITVINLYNREVIAELDIGMRPDVVLPNTYDRFVTFGSKDGSVSTWDLATLQQVLRIDGLTSALSMTFSFDGSHLFVVEAEKKNVSVIDMGSRKKIAEISLGGEDDPDAQVSAMSRSADGYTGYISVTSENRVVVVDLADWTIKESVPVGREPIRPYSTADNRYVLVPNKGDQSLTVLSALSRQVVATIPTGVDALALNTGWLDTVAFVMPASGNEIAVINLRELKQEKPIKVPGRTDDGLVTSDSKTLVASIVDSGQVAVINARSHELEALIETNAATLEGVDIALSNNVCH